MAPSDVIERNSHLCPECGRRTLEPDNVISRVGPFCGHRDTKVREQARQIARLRALLAERDAELARHAALLDEMRQTWDTLDDIDVFIDPERAGEWHAARNRMDYLVSDHRAALAARGG